MASVTSLGVHQPAGLQHAIEEGILPPDAPHSSYTWEVSITSEDGRQYEDEILTTDTCVLWSRGGSFRKSFKFDLEKESVTQALLTYFPASADKSRGDGQTDGATTVSPAQRALSRALVVFLKTQAHIYFLSGGSHVVHMPFEVESACAAPRGVVIQRKPRDDNTSVSLRLPKVPPNSFISSHLSPVSRRPDNRSVTEFSTEGLGNPKTLPLRLSFTLENMWQTPMETSDSHWPRLVCLTDPLLELGLVVTHSGKPASKGRPSSTGPLFLPPSEEILHVESVKVPHISRESAVDLSVAVTVNRETNMYTIWRLTYLENDDLFVGRQKKRRSKPSRRRSSMAPALASGATTPVHPSMRESFGAPLPGKRSRKSIKAGKDKVLDHALSSLDPDKDSDVTRRQSRRVSSLLARADLSASQDRSTFEQSIHAGLGSRRAESHGSQRPRISSGYGRPSFGGTFNLSQSINSMPEAPVDDLLDELRAGGDFEGFRSMGLDDHDFEGLAHEMLLTKIHSVSMDNTNVRYSLSGKPARTQSKVFIVAGPPTAADDQGRALLLVAIQDPVDKRLQLLTLHVEPQEDRTPTKSSVNAVGDLEAFNIVPGDPRRVQSVVDSCKVSDGCEAIMILSEDKHGGRELSLQSPWGKVTTVTLPPLHLGTPHCLEDFGTRRADHEFLERQIPRFDVTGTQIDSIRHSNSLGVIELRDKEGRFHRIRIQLQPSSPHVRKALDVCRSVLHSSYADKLLAGWWHVMRWLHDVKPRGSEEHLANTEWSAAVILILASFLALGHNSETSLQTLGSDMRGTSAITKWEKMHLRETPNSSACPPWMRSKAWQWLLEDEAPDAPSSFQASWPCETFMSVHVSLAKQWMASNGGVLAFGFEGYMPTALNGIGSGREMAAWSMALALHLLVEEQKLNILSLEDKSPGQGDLRAVLCQVSKWLGWQRYEAMYALGMQADLAATHDLVPFVLQGVAEPPSDYCILTWIQGHLATGRGTEFPTLPDVYTTATHDTHTGNLRKELWKSLTPRTAMFAKLFGLLQSTTNRYEMVAAMHECGFTPQILETLPEAILTPLQDVISICQPDPPPSWPKDLLALVSRTDMDAVLRTRKTRRAPDSDTAVPSHVAKWDFHMLCQHLDDFHDHIEETDTTHRQAVVRSLFREDRRLNEAQGMLSTVKNRVLRLDPKPEWSEAEYLERQKGLVGTMATSTLAIPAGRGLLYYALRYPLLTQKYQIGGFNLTCIIKPANNTVAVDKSMFVEEKVNWAFFHQGVAGGLAISPQAKGIDTSWILYNKPGQDLSNRHAGFLLALGLNGHLKSVAKWVAFKYLTPKHTMTSIGLLLGLAASYLGTMDSLITRLLSVHVTRMLPRGAAELNLSRHTQTTGIMGIGLLYCNSQHRRMSEIMMSEIEHTEDREEEDPLRDESYRLAAGFALGFINLGKGGDLRGLRDMRLAEKLLTIATSTKRVELVHVLDRSAAAAVIAIALIFMKSEDHIVARKIDVPDTILQFDYVRPDILLLRTVAKNLILWEEINPSLEWIRDSLPPEYRAQLQLTNITKLYSRDMPFFSILAGLCFALGLRFAGSANVKVRDLLIQFLDEFRRIVRIVAIDFDSELTRGNVRMCMDMVALSCASVMAGTGDIVVLRRLRALHGRDDSSTTYGSHMAAHLAIGALFLGCGTCTFGTSNIAVAALLLSFYPLFPANVQDNRSHLQAFRHFWVLATEPRCLVAKDLITGQPLNVPILVHLVPGSPSAAAAQTQPAARADEAVALRRQTPCLLPPLDDVLRVETDARALGYWDLAVDFAREPRLKEEFRANQTVYLRRRPGNETTFSTTLRALGGSSIPPVFGAADGAGGGGAAGGANAEPFEWVFSLDALKDLTRAERAVVLDRLGSGGSGVGEGEGASTAVDARLVLRAGLEPWRWSRDGLLGLRLLFEWAERRGLFLAPGDASKVEGEEEAKEQAAKAGRRTRRDTKGKGKKAESRKGKNKVSLGTAAYAEPNVGGVEDKKTEVAGAGGGSEGSWWLRDSVIEELKGRTWLASREG